MMRLGRMASLLVFVAGCFGVTPTPLTRSVNGSLVFLKNGGIYGVFDPYTAACAAAGPRPPEPAVGPTNR